MSISALLELAFVDVAGAVQVDVDRQRLGDADRVGELQRAAVGEARGDDVLGEIARRVGGRAVDLGRVLAGEGAAAVRRRAAVGVDDDLAAGEAAVAVGAADEELAGRVDVPDGLRGDPALRQRLDDVGADDRARRPSEVRLGIEMLVRDDDLRRLDRLAVLVAHRHLALGVGPERLLAARRGALREMMRRILCAYWIGAGISSGVSRQA